MDGWMDNCIDRWIVKYLPVAKKREICYCATNTNKVIGSCQNSLDV